jgi:cyclin E
MACPLTPFSDRLSPLPALKWANSQEVWEIMCHKDEISSQDRDENLFSKHPGLQPRMRAILLEWLIEVSWLEIELWFVEILLSLPVRST